MISLPIGFDVENEICMPLNSVNADEQKKKKKKKRKVWHLNLL